MGDTEGISLVLDTSNQPGPAPIEAREARYLPDYRNRAGTLWCENGPLLSDMNVLGALHYLRDSLHTDHTTASLRELAESSGYSRPIVRCAIRRLLANGDIRYESKGGPGHTTVYRIVSLSRDVTLDAVPTPPAPSDIPSRRKQSRKADLRMKAFVDFGWHGALNRAEVCVWLTYHRHADKDGDACLTIDAIADSSRGHLERSEISASREVLIALSLLEVVDPEDDSSSRPLRIVVPNWSPASVMKAEG